ncbi:hypothetical protein [Salirhabdus salicampi]|uniref:hypothetical protein n=1 Tax=Salirhabdus salicampi TaxID=476102 RepID=UPI0020C35938|nr:hypothetical protein [Salirhabdus salicampi]MCP8616280.1 hypothetical protein [Salirhabdus salicampi]
MRNIIVMIPFIFILFSCNNEKLLEPDTPTNASTLMKHQMNIDHYDGFKALFYEQEVSISNITFKELQNITTTGTRYQTFELLTFDNGEMLLIEFVRNLEDNEEYQIVNVKKVPDEMKELFTP